MSNRTSSFAGFMIALVAIAVALTAVVVYMSPWWRLGLGVASLFIFMASMPFGPNPYDDNRYAAQARLFMPLRTQRHWVVVEIFRDSLERCKRSMAIEREKITTLWKMIWKNEQ